MDKLKVVKFTIGVALLAFGLKFKISNSDILGWLCLLSGLFVTIGTIHSD